MELTALAAKSNYSVELTEAEHELGGQLRFAVKSPGYEQYAT